MLQSFSFNLLFSNARFYLASSSGTPLGSRNNSYESLKDASDMQFSTPSSSPRTPCPEVWPSQTTLPSSAQPTATFATIQSPLGLLPFATSQTTLSPKPDPATPSLLDTSISFARMMDRTGSPASFLTCSSGWDPGIVCGAARFPSLLHSGQSVDNFHPIRETRPVPCESKAGAECSLLETGLSRASQSPPRVSFCVATPFYLSPSLGNGEFTRLQPSDFVAHTLPCTWLTPPLPSPTTSEYSTPSPQTASPRSDFSLEESTTSSIFHDPFHWDTVLAGLSPSPRHFPMLPINEHSSARPSPLTTPFPSFVQCYETPIHSSQRDSIFTAASPQAIPTIVVRGPDSDVVPTQASVSSIIGLYGGRPESVHLVSGETLELTAPKESPELESGSDDTDGESSGPESEFEIVTVPALKVRLDDILETDRMDVENAFGSLMTLGSIASGNSRSPTTEERSSTEFLANGRGLPSFSSMTEPSIDMNSGLSSGQIVQNHPKASTSTSFASTAKLYYAQSGTSISGQSTTSSWNPTASESETDCPWLFRVEDGDILELPRSSSVHKGGKFADKLARFPNVPKSPQLTPLPSPFSSPPPSPSPANLHFLDGPLLPQKKPGGPATPDGIDTNSLLSPFWERNTTECTTMLSPGMSTLCQPMAAPQTSGIKEIGFGELDVDLGLSSDFVPRVSTSFPTNSSSSSEYNTKPSTAQGGTISYSRHVRFETADFRTSSIVVGSKRHSPHHRRPPLDRSKTCLKRKPWSGRAWDRRDSSDASVALVRPPGVDSEHLPSSFSSGSISKKGLWWRRGRILVAITRVRRVIGGCLSSREEDTGGGSVVWATEHDYWSDYLARGESQRSGDPTQDDDGTELLRRVRRYSRVIPKSGQTE